MCKEWPDSFIGPDEIITPQKGDSIMVLKMLILEIFCSTPGYNRDTFFGYFGKITKKWRHTLVFYFCLFTIRNSRLKYL